MFVVADLSHDVCERLLRRSLPDLLTIWRLDDGSM